jgi:TPR repeat protein
MSRKSIQLLLQASENGHVEALRKVGIAYQDGSFGVPVNWSKALECYTKAADKGDGKAHYYLGTAYHYGDLGITLDISKAIEAYNKAIKHGYIDASFELAKIYHTGGEGITKDFKRALDLYIAAGQQECAKEDEAFFQAAKIYEGVFKNHRLALKYYTKAGEKGHAEAMYKTGIMYESGAGGAQDLHQATLCYKKADQMGYIEAKAALKNITDSKTV